MIEMTKMPSTSTLISADRRIQQEALPHRKSKTLWHSAFLSELFQSRACAELEALKKNGFSSAEELNSVSKGTQEHAMLPGPQEDSAGQLPDGYLASRREANRRTAAAKQAAEAASNAATAKRKAQEELAEINKVFFAWIQVFVEAVSSVDPALVKLACPHEVSQEVASRSAAALLTEADTNQKLLLATGIALNTGGPGSYAALPGMSSTASAQNQETLTRKENEHV